LCHPGSLTSYSCTSCHSQSKMDDKHKEMGGYSGANCTDCHPNGRKEEGGD
jgi:DNA-directed RNA polymerase subunit RPC12/RpoP